MLKSIKKSTIMGIFDIAIFEILRVFQGHFFQKDCFGRGGLNKNVGHHGWRMEKIFENRRLMTPKIASGSAFI